MFLAFKNRAYLKVQMISLRLMIILRVVENCYLIKKGYLVQCSVYIYIATIKITDTK